MPEDGASSGDALPERVLELRPGDLLVFEEVLGPRTGNPADADPNHRHVVRLTRVEPAVDDLLGIPLLEIEWAEEDALPFPLCVSTVGPPPDCAALGPVSVARGNVVLVDHGRRSERPEPLGKVPTASVDAKCEREGRPADVVRRAGPFRPTVREASLTFSEPLRPGAPAARLLDQDPRRAVPWIRLASHADDPRADPGDQRSDGQTSDQGGGAAALSVAERTSSRSWSPRRDLLASHPDDDHFVVEMDDRRRAELRFGDGELGRQPEAGQTFEAFYRVGNGPAGNVGADTLTLAVTRELISGVTLRPRNPIAARGGTAPEPVEEVKLFAPHAFRQEIARAVTPEDYARLAERHPAVQRAAAVLRWNGSWYEVRVAIDARGRAEADPRLLAEIEEYLYRFRRIGHDLAVRPAHPVPLDVKLEVCVEPAYLRAHVQGALRERFGTRRLTDGTRGFFHPDELTFGGGVAVSRLMAAAQAIPGISSVVVSRLERLFAGPDGEIEEGMLPIGPLEIARLDNDPNFPENGRIRFDLRGGR